MSTAFYVVCFLGEPLESLFHQRAAYRKHYSAVLGVENGSGGAVEGEHGNQELGVSRQGVPGFYAQQRVNLVQIFK